ILFAAFSLVVSGVSISCLNKWIFVTCRYPYPLFLSALHMLSAICLVCTCAPRPSGELPPRAKARVFALSLTFCASIALGNLGLRHVQLSFAHRIYAATPLITMAMSQVAQGRRQGAVKYAAMVPVCLGAGLSVLGEVDFSQMGCFFVCTATVLRGIKSIQQSVLLQDENIHSIVLLYVMAVPSFCILLSATLLFESRALWELVSRSDSELWAFLFLSCASSVLYNLSGFYVIKLTSAVTLHMLGNLNLIGNLLASQALFGGEVTWLSVAGTLLTLSGVVIYQNSDSLGTSVTRLGFWGRTRPHRQK
uniref:Solute carrier family 35 member E4 n=1 Tax=Latimeria chalumnae TaxID=7897 RepID=H3A4E4_LATCH